MDYKKKYEQALERCKKEFNFNNLAYSHEEIKQKLERVFPELNVDERIKKGIIEYLEQSQFGEEHYQVDDDIVRGYISWLEKQSKQEQLYIRFGKIPTDEKSKIYQGEIEVGTENGVSVYPAFKTDKGDIILGLSLPITKTTLYTQQHLIEYDDRPCYLVKGDYVGKDTDGQPLINNISIIEKIDDYRVKEEKQNKQKPVDKVEPKFKVGDWIVTPNNETKQKELKKIENKPTWSEEDENLLKLSLENLAELKNRFGEKYGRVGECICWLKSIKQRMKGE